MLTAAPTALMALGSRIDVIARHNADDLFRTASYDLAETWQQPWTSLMGPPFQGVTASAPAKEAQERSPACAASGDGRIIHLCSRAEALPGAHERGNFWYRRTDNFTHSWNDWSAIGEGEFLSAPSIATSGNGEHVVAAGLGKDKRMWFARSDTWGIGWQLAWAPIGEGVFQKYTPAITVSADAQRVYAFGFGNDTRFWYAFSTQGGNHWDMAWLPIGEGKFTSGPAAAASADGKRVFVFGRGLDNRMWFARSNDFANSWDIAWAQMPSGSNFQSAPSAVASWDGQIVHVFAMGGDNRIWRAATFDGGNTWATAWAQVGTKTF